MALKDRISITKQIIESFDSTDMESDEVAHFQNELAIMQALERAEFRDKTNYLEWQDSIEKAFEKQP